MKKNSRSGTVILCLIIGLSIVYTLLSDSITLYAADILKLCASSVIPSLFPFMVLSYIASDLASAMTEQGSRGTAVLLAVFLGALCGFPVGAATVASMYKNGALPKKNAEYLCALCNNTGPAFVIGVIGKSFWGSATLGIIFYICQLTAAFVVYVAFRIIFRNRISSKAVSANEAYRHSEISTSAKTDTRFSSMFCNAVAASSVNVIRICGYIVFFKVICDTLHAFMPRGYTSDVIYTVISSVLEFTTGTYSSAELGGALGIMLCGFSIGFSGLSVMAQSAGLLTSAGLSCVPLFYMKLACGTVSALLSWLIYRLFGLRASVTVGALYCDFSLMQSITAALFTVYLLVIFIRLVSSSDNSDNTE